MFHDVFDFPGPAADFNLDGHVDSFEAGLFFRMMEMEATEVSWRSRSNMALDDNLDDDLSLDSLNLSFWLVILGSLI